jgi:peptide subunit release factor 1 (eRF1)
MSTEAEQNIQTWKIKKLIKSLDSARGCVLAVATLMIAGD